MPVKYFRQGSMYSLIRVIFIPSGTFIRQARPFLSTGLSQVVTNQAMSAVTVPAKIAVENPFVV